MNDLPLVSVVMITYNHEIYISQAIEGVLMQQCDFGIELIIANDKSPDNTDALIQDILKNDPRANSIRYINRPENIGMLPNFIDALSRGKGRYIALCEGDDYWTDPLKLQKQVNFLENNPDYAIYVHNAINNDLSDGSQTPFNKKLKGNTFTTKDLILKPWFTPTASIVFRNNNFIMPAWDLASGDLTLLLLNSLNGKIYYLNEAMSVYNFGVSGSASKNLLSQSKIRRLFKLYKNKWRILNYFDKHTKFKFGFYTSVKRIKIVAGFTRQLLR